MLDHNAAFALACGRCVLNYHVMVLWCSDTNFTSIPLPEDIAAYADPSVSKELYFNSSCLESVNPGIVYVELSLCVVGTHSSKF